VLLLFAGAIAIGSYVYSTRADRDAAQLGSSTRGTDGSGIQEQQTSEAARGPSTSGSKTHGAVPPASR
jgi:hypothetical protein